MILSTQFIGKFQDKGRPQFYQQMLLSRTDLEMHDNEGMGFIALKISESYFSVSSSSEPEGNHRSEFIFVDQYAAAPVALTIQDEGNLDLNSKHMNLHRFTSEFAQIENKVFQSPLFHESQNIEDGTLISMTCGNDQWDFRHSVLCAGSDKPSSLQQLVGLDRDTTWAPAVSVAHQWFQFDFGHPVKVTKISTQGDPYQQHWVKTFRLRLFGNWILKVKDLATTYLMVTSTMIP